MLIIKAACKTSNMPRFLPSHEPLNCQESVSRSRLHRVAFNAQRWKKALETIPLEVLELTLFNRIKHCLKALEEQKEVEVVRINVENSSL